MISLPPQISIETPHHKEISMQEIIPQQDTQCNNYLSSAKNNSLKLHSADLSYLLILKWFHDRRLKCYLSKEQWPVWLERFGGKKVDYRNQRARWSKMRAMGCSTTAYQNQNRGLHFIHSITDLGLAYLKAFQQGLGKGLSKDIKNILSKSKKRYSEKQKTSSPLKKDLKIYEINIGTPVKSPSHPFIPQLKGFGMYEGFANRLLREHTEQEITNAIKLTSSRNVKNPGAYIARILTKPLQFTSFNKNDIQVRGQDMSDAKKDKTQFANALSSQDATARALDRARAHLEAQGITPPVRDGSVSDVEWYDNMRRYSERESALAIQFMRAPSGPRPIAFDSTQSGKGWTSYND